MTGLIYERSTGISIFNLCAGDNIIYRCRTRIDCRDFIDLTGCNGDVIGGVCCFIIIVGNSRRESERVACFRGFYRAAASECQSFTVKKLLLELKYSDVHVHTVRLDCSGDSNITYNADLNILALFDLFLRHVEILACLFDVVRIQYNDMVAGYDRSLIDQEYCAGLHFAVHISVKVLCTGHDHNDTGLVLVYRIICRSKCRNTCHTQHHNHCENDSCDPFQTSFFLHFKSLL